MKILCKYKWKICGETKRFGQTSDHMTLWQVINFIFSDYASIVKFKSQKVWRWSSWFICGDEERIAWRKGAFLFTPPPPRAGSKPRNFPLAIMNTCIPGALEVWNWKIEGEHLSSKSCDLRNFQSYKHQTLVHLRIFYCIPPKALPQLQILARTLPRLKSGTINRHFCIGEFSIACIQKLSYTSKLSLPYTS